jgi:hypothetical protein
MSEKTILIEPYHTGTNLISLKGKVSLDGIEDEIIIPDKNHLNLFNLSLDSRKIVTPRSHNTLTVNLTTHWAGAVGINDLKFLIDSSENPEEILSFVIEIRCKNTRWCSEQKHIFLSEIGTKKIYSFEIPINEVKELITVSTFLLREKGNSKTFLHKANTKYSILSENEEITIQIDERRDIGGAYLPIDSDNIGDKVFEIKGLDNETEIPRIKYSEEFKEYFTRDDLQTVNTVFMMSMFYFLDSYLKWLIFVSRNDASDKQYKSVLDLFSRYCEITKPKLIDIIQMDKYSPEQTKEFLNLSQDLFSGLQTNSNFKYKKELLKIIKSDA